jgi:hypothetical protein
MGYDRINRIIRGQGEEPHAVFSNYSGRRRRNRYFYLRTGKVVAVDLDRYRMKIEWLQGAGSPNWMPISLPYAGPAGVFGAVPEEQSFVICGYYDTGLGKGDPFPLVYLPSGLAKALEYNTSKLNPDPIATEDTNEVFRRFRDMDEGDMIMMSSLGGIVFVNKNVEIKDALKDSIILRNADQSIIATSLNNFMFADGASVSAGPIIRNAIQLYDSDGARIENAPVCALEVPFEGGQSAKFIVPFGAIVNDANYETEFYSEYRVTVDELCDRQLDINDINEGVSTSVRDPLVSLVLGNYVGAIDNNKQSMKNYGRILRPVFTLDDRGSFKGFSFLECSQQKGQDEVSSLGLAYALDFHQSSSFIEIPSTKRA